MLFDFFQLPTKIVEGFPIGLINSASEAIIADPGGMIWMQFDLWDESATNPNHKRTVPMDYSSAHFPQNPSSSSPAQPDSLP